MEDKKFYGEGEDSLEEPKVEEEVKEEVGVGEGNPKEEPKELTTTEDSAVTRISGDGGTPLGFEDTDMQDIQLPRVSVLQGLSKLVTEGEGKVGQLANSLTKEIYGEELTFIPLFAFKSRVKFQLAKGAVCMSLNALKCSYNTDGAHQVADDCLNCVDTQWPTDGEGAKEGPPCSLVYNFPVLNADNLKEFPVSISCMRTGTKAAKKLVSMAAITGEDFFARKYRMVTKKSSSDKGEYFVADFELVGKVTDEEFKAALVWFKKLRQAKEEKSLSVDLTDNSNDNEAEVPF